MPDTRRSLSSLQTLLADNTAGDISAQDARDVLISEHPEKTSQSAAIGSIPGSGQLTGDLFLPTDGFHGFRYNGTIWAPWGPIFPMVQPSNTGFSWFNQGSATIDTNGGGLHLNAVGLGGGWRLRVKTNPTTPYTITVGFNVFIFSGASQAAALIFKDSAGGFITYHIDINGSAVRLMVEKWDSAGVFVGTISNSTMVPQGGLWWLRIGDDGTTNRTYDFSMDGQHWYNYLTHARTTHITADQVGFGVNQNAMTIYSWKEA